MPDPAAPAPPEAVVAFEQPDGTLIARWLCTPDRLEDLAVGWLLCEGLIERADEVHALSLTPAGNVRARLGEAALARIAAFHRDSGPGPARTPGNPIRAPVPLRPADGTRSLLADPGRLSQLFLELFEGARLKSIHGGGLHTGGCVVEGRITDIAEDVSRSAVVDKLVGAAHRDALPGGPPAGGAMFLLSGRISATIAAKLVRAGVAAAATISLPTSLAVDIAEQAGLAIVGRARRDLPFLYGAR
jgi:FdhD protein